MNTLQIIWISLLGVTSGYTLCLLHFPLGLMECDDVNNIPKVNYANVGYVTESPDMINVTSKVPPDGEPAARLSRGSVSSLFEKCIDIGYLLVFTLLASGIVKFLGVVGYKL